VFMMSSDAEEQEDELLVLSEILGPALSRESSDGVHRGKLSIEVRISDSVTIRDSLERQFSVNHLPPLTLEFKLPPDYPSMSPPEFKLRCEWLQPSQLAAVRDKLGEFWTEQEGTVILFLWLNFLQEELSPFISLESGGVDIAALANVQAARNTASASCSENSKDVSQAPNSTILDITVGIEHAQINGVNNFPKYQGESAPSFVNSSKKENEPANFRSQGFVLDFSLDTLSGVVRINEGDVMIDKNSIVVHNPRKLEASCKPGEKVELDIRETRSAFVGVNITGVGGKYLEGHPDVENVSVLDENVAGKVLNWNKRTGEGTLKAPKGEVYAYKTCIQYEDIKINDRVTFNVVRSKKWGVLASFVQKAETSKTLNIIDISADSNDDLEIFQGTVKKWNQNRGHGIIIDVSGKEWMFDSQDCLDDATEGFCLYAKGDHVTFSAKPIIDRRSTPKAYQVRIDLNPNELAKIESCNSKKSPSHSFSSKTVKPPDIGKNGTFSEIQFMQEKTSQPAIIQKESNNIVEKRPVSSPADRLVTLLKEYDAMKKEEEFAISLFTCEICFSDKLGSQSMKFKPCSHVYCRDCMTAYFTEKISVGSVSSLLCPTLKCESQALPQQVGELVDLALFEKYERILLETQLESMTDVVPCPRLQCQCPTIIDRETNLGQCPACQFAFCIYCKATYHGVSPCKFKTKEQRAILDSYSQAGLEERAFLEKRYGAKALHSMAADLASEDYMSQNAKHCPHCKAPIEKNEGCNKITCWRCSTNFCWLCGDKLPQANPYTHFNIMGNGCFGALFEGVDPMDNEEFFDEEGDDGDDFPAFLLI